MHLSSGLNRTYAFILIMQILFKKYSKVKALLGSRSRSPELPHTKEDGDLKRKIGAAAEAFPAVTQHYGYAISRVPSSPTHGDQRKKRSLKVDSFSKKHADKCIKQISVY